MGVIARELQVVGRVLGGEHDRTTQRTAAGTDGIGTFHYLHALQRIGVDAATPGAEEFVGRGGFQCFGKSQPIHRDGDAITFQATDVETVVTETAQVDDADPGHVADQVFHVLRHLLIDVAGLEHGDVLVGRPLLFTLTLDQDGVQRARMRGGFGICVARQAQRNGKGQ